jgi:hypothetical protein
MYGALRAPYTVKPAAASPALMMRAFAMYASMSAWTCFLPSGV